MITGDLILLFFFLALQLFNIMSLIIEIKKHGMQRTGSDDDGYGDEDASHRRQLLSRIETNFWKLETDKSTRNVKG